MPEKPRTAGGYRREHLALVRATCLYIATKLGDLMDDLVVVGGLVPSLLVDQESGEAGFERHAGTMDLDIGLTAAFLDRGKYREISDRLRQSGFAQNVNDAGNPTHQRWKIEAGREQGCLRPLLRSAQLRRQHQERRRVPEAAPRRRERGEGARSR